MSKPHTATSYYLTMTCQECHTEMYTLATTTTHHNGIPAIPWDIATSATFTCADCGTQHDTASDFDAVVITSEPEDDHP